MGLLKAVRKLAGYLQWGWNLADRLAFTEVIVGSKPITANMDEVYDTFQIEAQETHHGGSLHGRILQPDHEEAERAGLRSR
jgi:hypothetical protein